VSAFESSGFHENIITTIWLKGKCWLCACYSHH